MARFTAILGDLAGKLSGNVFAKNRFGSYVRSWKKPVDPKTLAQLQARASFSSAASGWHSLSDAFKALWNTFGLQFFVAKGSNYTGAYTGFNAFTALRQSALEASIWSGSFTMSSPTAALTFAPFSMAIAAPPVAAISGQIKDSTGHPLTQYLKAASLTSAGLVSITISFPDAQASSPIWEDPTTNEDVGYGIFATLPKFQAANYKGNPYGIALAYVKPIETATSWSSSGQFTLSYQITAGRIAGLKHWFNTGDVLDLTVTSISALGQQKSIGVKSVVVG